jgi:N-methylhydantoinase A/oxoprolinase/acetone carboxylase beta subunit
MQRLETLSDPELDARLRETRDAATPPDWQQEWWARMRYVGQGHELDVACAPGVSAAGLGRDFETIHERRFGFDLERPVEIVSVRFAATGSRRDVRFQRGGVSQWDEHHALDNGGVLDVLVRGPRSIALSDATMLVRDGWSARPREIGGWLMERES